MKLDTKPHAYVYIPIYIYIYVYVRAFVKHQGELEIKLNKENMKYARKEQPQLLYNNKNNSNKPNKCIQQAAFNYIAHKLKSNSSLMQSTRKFTRIKCSAYIHIHTYVH